MKRPTIQVHIVDPGPLSDDQIADIVLMYAQMLCGVLKEIGVTLGRPAVGIDGLPRDVLQRAIGAKP